MGKKSILNSYIYCPDPGTTQFQVGAPWLQHGTGWFHLGTGEFQNGFYHTACWVSISYSWSKHFKTSFLHFDSDKFSASSAESGEVGFNRLGNYLPFYLNALKCSSICLFTEHLENIPWYSESWIERKVKMFYFLVPTTTKNIFFTGKCLF